MSRQIDVDSLDWDDAYYLRGRPWLIEEAKLQGVDDIDERIESALKGGDEIDDQSETLDGVYTGTSDVSAVEGEVPEQPVEQAGDGESDEDDDETDEYSEMNLTQLRSLVKEREVETEAKTKAGLANALRKADEA